MDLHAGHSGAHHFRIVDGRYLNPALSLGWRTALSPENGELRSALTNAVATAGNGTSPLLLDRSALPGTEQITVLLPSEMSTAWIGHVLGAVAEVGASSPVSAVIGNDSAVTAVESAIRSVILDDNFGVSAELKSIMRRRAVGGHTRTIVTGTDPGQRWGGAAVALAIHLVTNRQSPRLATITEPTGPAETVQIVRGLHKGVPAVMWQVDAVQRTGLQVLEALMDAAENGIDIDAGTLVHAREELLPELLNYAKSPMELVRALTRYDLLDWDPQLVVNPRKSLAGPRAADVQHAISELLKPIADVLGRT